MRKSSFTPEQIAFALKQADSGIPVAEIVRKLEISEQTFYLREMVNDAGFKTKDQARKALVSYIELIVLQQCKKAFCARVYGSSGI